MPKGESDLRKKIIHQWVPEPNSILQFPWSSGGCRGFAPNDAYGTNEWLKCTPYAAGSPARTRPCISLSAWRERP